MTKQKQEKPKTRSWSALGLQHKRNQAFTDRKKRSKRGYRKHKGKNWD